MIRFTVWGAFFAGDFFLEPFFIFKNSFKEFIFFLFFKITRTFIKRCRFKKDGSI